MAEKIALQNVRNGTMIVSQATFRSISGYRVATCYVGVVSFPEKGGCDPNSSRSTEAACVLYTEFCLVMSMCTGNFKLLPSIIPISITP